VTQVHVSWGVGANGAACCIITVLARRFVGRHRTAEGLGHQEQANRRKKAIVLDCRQG
jgi:hypothetical protein